jgi:hypothetical protein
MHTRGLFFQWVTAMESSVHGNDLMQSIIESKNNLFSSKSDKMSTWHYTTIISLLILKQHEQ